MGGGASIYHPALLATPLLSERSPSFVIIGAITSSSPQPPLIPWTQAEITSQHPITTDGRGRGLRMAAGLVEDTRARMHTVTRRFVEARRRNRGTLACIVLCVASSLPACLSSRPPSRRATPVALVAVLLDATFRARQDSLAIRCRR